MQHGSACGINSARLQALYCASLECLGTFPPVLRRRRFNRLPELLAEQRHQIRRNITSVTGLKLFKIGNRARQIRALCGRQRQLKQSIRPIFAVHAGHAQICPRRFILTAQFFIGLRKFPLKRFACTVLLPRLSEQCHSLVISSGKAVFVRAADPVFTCARNFNHLGHDTPPRCFQSLSCSFARCACASRSSSSSPLKR